MTRFEIATTDGGVVSIGEAELMSFAQTLGGSLLTPRHDRYEDARQVWNGLIDKRPGLIIQCAGTADVVAAVRFARSHGLLVSVRGGGHNVAGNAVCDGGMVIDLARMRRVGVEPGRRFVRAGGGATLGHIDTVTAPLGLAVPLGLVSATGVAGLTLHGGYGWLSRHYGLTVDSVIRAEVVLSDGAVVIASAHENPELFWALRGGGGNFGVVTDFEFQAYPIDPQVWVCACFYPIDQGDRVLRRFRDYMATAPEELGALLTFWTTGDGEPFPPAARGKPTVAIAACWSGPFDRGEAAIRPLREAAAPLVDLSRPMPYLDLQRFFDADYPDGRFYYWKSRYLASLDDKRVSTIASLSTTRPSPFSSVDVWALGGAVDRPPPGGTAFPNRRMPYLLALESSWEDRRDSIANIDWTRHFYDVTGQNAPPSPTYLNFPGFAEEGEAMVRSAFGAHFGRLRAAKAQYDPGNFFRTNFNIRP